MCVPIRIKYWCKKCHLPFTKVRGDAINFPSQIMPDRCPYCGSTKLSRSLLGSFAGDYEKGKK